MPYPEQKAGYVIPAKYARYQRSETKRSTATGTTVTPIDTIHNSSSDGIPSSERSGEVDIEFTELDLSGRPREKEVDVPKEVVLVDWDGEDDPENPLNW